MKLLFENWRQYLNEANFDSSTGEPTTEKGKALCAKNAACREKWLKGEKDSADAPGVAAMKLAKEKGLDAAQLIKMKIDKLEKQKNRSPGDEKQLQLLKRTYNKMSGGAEAKSAGEEKFQAHDKADQAWKFVFNKLRTAFQKNMQKAMDSMSAGDMSKAKEFQESAGRFQEHMNDLGKLQKQKKYEKIIAYAKKWGYKAN
jgi:predicted transcriptional regulator